MNKPLYDRLGIDTSALGCVMLDAESLNVHDVFPREFWYYGDLPGRRSGGPELETHVTLLFGLLQNAHVWREYVDEVLDGWEPPDVIEVREFEVLDGRGYDVVVGEVWNQGKLREAHSRLSRLPHVNTFPYRPHVTIGYVHQGVGEYMLPRLYDFLSKNCPGKVAQLPSRGLNYGDLPVEAQQ